MANAKLLIKYNSSFLCEHSCHGVDFITVPNYYSEDDFSNISIFITLLLSGYINEDYCSSIFLEEGEWFDLFELYFAPDYLLEIDENTYLYDLDALMEDYRNYNEMLEFSQMEGMQISTLESTKMPSSFVFKTPDELILDHQQHNAIEDDRTVLYGFYKQHSQVNKDLFYAVQNIMDNTKNRTEKDVLLLYSGGKDSTLSAVRLNNQGYNVHFIHFSNGQTLDADKPFLTFKYLFRDKSGFNFFPENREVDISVLFHNYFSDWMTKYGNIIEDGTISSEIRCLSCRMAMYTKALEYAKQHGYQYIAEGARISQKFMIEQPEMLELFRKLASQYGIQLLFPVLFLEDDNQEIKELLKNGYSSKTWESKCLIGRKAKQKTELDKQIIMDYYKKNIEPRMVKILKI